MHVVRDHDYYLLKSKLAEISYENLHDWYVIAVNLRELGISIERQRIISEISLPHMIDEIYPCPSSEGNGYFFLGNDYNIILFPAEHQGRIVNVVGEIARFYQYKGDIGQFFGESSHAISLSTLEAAKPYLEQICQHHVIHTDTPKALLPEITQHVRDEYEMYKQMQSIEKPVMLSVDDEPHMHILIRSIVQQDFHVICAFDAESAINKFIEHQPSICIMDIGLPNFPGHEVSEWFQRLDPTVKMIMLSASRKLEDVQACYRLGIKHYLTKPFRPITLKEAINDCFTRQVA